MPTYVYVDETKARGYVLVAATVVAGDCASVRAVLKNLVLPGQRSLHMKKESDPRRRTIADTIGSLGVGASIYDAGRRYRTERDARAACLEKLVKDAASYREARIVLDLDPTLQQWDNQQLVERVREADARERLTYWHDKPAQEPLLSIPDAVAWCWAKGGYWRERIRPVVVCTMQV